MMKTTIQPKEKRGLTTTRIIALGFALAILVGSLLLMCPFSSADGTWTPYLDALFTATTSICVTGLVTVTTAFHWSLAGQIIILILAQLGGLGVLTVGLCLLVLLGQKISLKGRMLIRETYNMDTLSGLVRMIRRIVKGTLILEGIGAIFYAIVYIPEFGFWPGLWKAIFNAVSTFCNAGMDIVGDSSLRAYVTDPVINITTMTLIVLSGLGFIVWWDLIDNWKARKQDKRSFISKLSLHTKLVLITTTILIVVGAVFFFLLEYHNPDTIGNLSLGDKLMAAFFQSITTRTAGFETIPQGALTDGSSLLTMILMVIGGSPAGTAGGIKTTTVAILVLAVVSSARGNHYTRFLNRKVSTGSVQTALTVFMMAFIVVMTGSMLLFVTDGFGFTDTMYEICSAMGTVGLTRGITSQLSSAGKCIIIVIMYIGRLGPVTLALALAEKRKSSETGITLPEERIIIG